MPALDPVSVFVTAEQFRSASKWLIHARGMGYEADVGIPTVTCAAMALELYLKCLIATEGTENPIIHDLRHLFEKLSPSLQTAVRSHFDAYSDEVKQFDEAALAKAGSPPLKRRLRLCDRLEPTGICPRPIHLRQSLHPSSGWIADAIIDCARRVILDAHPDWEGLRMASPEVVLKTHPASPIP